MAKTTIEYTKDRKKHSLTLDTTPIITLQEGGTIEYKAGTYSKLDTEGNDTSYFAFIKNLPNLKGVRTDFMYSAETNRELVDLLNELSHDEADQEVMRTVLHTILTKHKQQFQDVCQSNADLINLMQSSAMGLEKQTSLDIRAAELVPYLISDKWHFRQLVNNREELNNLLKVMPERHHAALNDQFKAAYPDTHRMFSTAAGSSADSSESVKPTRGPGGPSRS